MKIHEMTAIGTEVIHFYGTEGGWFYTAVCGDDDYTVDIVNVKGKYVQSLGTAADRAEAVRMMEAHQATLIDNTKAGQYASYRTHSDGRRYQ